MEKRFWVSDCDGEWRVVHSVEVPVGALYGPYISRQAAEEQVNYWRRRAEKREQMAVLIMYGWIGLAIVGTVIFYIDCFYGK